MKERLKRFVFGLLRKDPESVIVSFWSGEGELVRAMAAEIRKLEPKRRHFVVTLSGADVSGDGVCDQDVPGATMVRLAGGNAWRLLTQTRRALRGYRIGLAPVLRTREPHPLRIVALLTAPFRLLIYNARLERHHLKLTHPVASLLFLSGVERDRIYLRPRWLTPWKKRGATASGKWGRILNGRPLSPHRKRIGVLAPYVPYPLSHGGAVRIFNLLRETAAEFDIFLFAFQEEGQNPAPLLKFCARVILVDKPLYREPRWSTMSPPDVHEYESSEMRTLIAALRAEFTIPILQVEYTQLASYPGDILVEHDITFDLYRQVFRERRTPLNWWNYFRWRCFEEQAFWNYRAIAVMSTKDATLLGDPKRGRIVENGVDLERFVPRGESGGGKLLFIGSFRHFPNVTAYRFLIECIWPLLLRRIPDATLTCIAGPDYRLHWARLTGEREPAAIKGVRVMGFVEDVRPAYADTNVVVVPTTVSAGTNVKVLEAMAMERAVVSTTSGCSGLGLRNGESICIADDPREFADAVALLLENFSYRSRMARTAREHVELHFGWEALGHKQRAIYRELLTGL